MKRTLSLAKSILVVLFIFVAPTVLASQKCTTIKYFTDTKKGFPYFPINEISEKRTQDLNTYLEGCFDGEGKQIGLRKILNENIYFVFIYEYDGEKIKKVKEVNDNGDSITVFEY